MSQRGSAGSILEYYRTLIALAEAEAVVTDGDFQLLAPAPSSAVRVPPFHAGRGHPRARQPLDEPLTIEDADLLDRLARATEVLVGNSEATSTGAALNPARRGAPAAESGSSAGELVIRETG